MYKYRLYGLNVASNLQLNCYPHEFENEDIYIKLTKSENEAKSLSCQLCDPDKPYTIKPSNGSGIIYICGKKNIVVYYRSDYDFECSLVNYLFGFAFSYILFRRHIYLLHGSSIAIDDGAVVIVGNSGAGKSSLAAGFAQRGGMILADDMTRIEINTDTPYVYPSYPARRLCRNTIEHLRLDMSGTFEILGDNEKFLLCKDSWDVFLNKNVPLNSIIFLSPKASHTVQLVREDVKSAILIMYHNFYNNWIILRSDFKSDYLNFILLICERIPIYTLYRPKNEFTIDEQISVIMSEIYKKDCAR